jgi:rare lipoprotein A
MLLKWFHEPHPFFVLSWRRCKDRTIAAQFCARYPAGGNRSSWRTQSARTCFAKRIDAQVSDRDIQWVVSRIDQTREVGSIRRRLSTGKRIDVFNPIAREFKLKCKFYRSRPERAGDGVAPIPGVHRATACLTGTTADGLVRGFPKGVMMIDMCTAPTITASSHSKTIGVTLAAALLYFVAFGFDCRADSAATSASTSIGALPAPKPRQDTTGKERLGKASFYAKSFSGKKMADGNIMDPHQNNAASRTLPLGTVAKVTNLETGKSAIVTIEDRGPYVDGRIVDLSPATAQNIGLSRREGIAKVAVAPITVPLPGGRVKLGSAATAENIKIASLVNKDRKSAISRW